MTAESPLLNLIKMVYERHIEISSPTLSPALFYIHKKDLINGQKQFSVGFQVLE